MNNGIKIYLIMSVVFALAGGAGGWYFHASTGSHGSHTGQDHAQDEHEEHDTHEASMMLSLSPQALANLDVQVRAIEEQAYQVFESIPARIVETPRTHRDVVAPVGGVVQRIVPDLGEMVNTDAIAVEILRDALPRPTLGLTEDLLKPASEDFHQTKGELRKALKVREVIVNELERLGSIGSTKTAALPLIPKQELINLRYEKVKTEQEIENLRQELHLHGLSSGQITKVEQGDELDLNLQLWRAVLERNGIWNDQANAVLETLPADIRQRPWVIATIGELITQDLLSQTLLDWFKAEPAASEHFIHIAGLLLSGESLEAIRQWHALGALEPLVHVRIPADPEDWDVEAIRVSPGEHVDRGQPLITLINARELYLESYPVGGEAVALSQALENKRLLSAVPLVPGTGPTLEGLAIQSLSGDKDGTPVGRVTVTNTPLAVTANGKVQFRSWALRNGLRYLLRVPVQSFEDVLVVPVDAVVDSGADKIVFVQNGDAFAPARVVVLHTDHESAVLGAASELFPGDPVVTNGAFALNLAMRAGSGGAVDPHAGHNH